MNEILQPGQIVNTEPSSLSCEVEDLLGRGGQGEVYQANLGGKSVALKWYYPHYAQQVDSNIRERLEEAVDRGSPSDRFLWPLEIACANNAESFGYIMPLRDSSYRSLFDLMRRKIEPSFCALATAGFQLADSFMQLHSKGLCYCDISFGNVFLNPDSGDILICDNDNVDIDGAGKSPILGTPSFMAPEIVRGEAKPNTKTDLFSLAVLLFYVFMMHHPLEGKKETEINCFDLPAKRKLYGAEPLFIFDPEDLSNAPIRGFHDNAIEFWKVYPNFLKDIFTQAFTKGLNPNNRVTEGEWRKVMIRLRDSILYCQSCGAENFHDPNGLKNTGGKLNLCWQCGNEVQIPPRIRIRKNIVMLNYNTELFPHHIDQQKLYDFSRAIAKVNQHPQNPSIWGLKNLSNQKWACTVNGTVKEIDPGRSISLAVGTKINFGREEGEIRN